MYKITTVENQRKFILPYNDVSKTIFYDQRIAVSPPLDTPIAWRISKVEGVNPLGIMHYTLAQVEWNSHTDVVEYDEDGNVTGMWCDLLSDSNLPSDTTPTPPPQEYGDYAEITYSGTKPHLKVNGSYKTITLTYYSTQTDTVDQTPGEWSYLIDDTDVSDLVKVLETDSPNTIKVKFLGDEEYLGKVLTIKNTRDNIIAEKQFEIVSL